MEFHDLYLKWGTDKKATGPSRQLKINELISNSSYQVHAFNYSLHTKPYPSLELPVSRLTVKNDFQTLLSSTELLSQYDLVSARPESESDFHYCCIHGEVDIISLRLHERLGIRIKLNLIQEAMRRGIMFELCYSPALKDMNARRVFLANASNIIRATRAKHIIFSSGAKDLFEQRSPEDVINLGIVLGLSQKEATKSITENPRTALVHAKARRVFKSTIQVVDKNSFVEKNGWEALPSTF